MTRVPSRYDWVRRDKADPMAVAAWGPMRLPRFVRIDRRSSEDYCVWLVDSEGRRLRSGMDWTLFRALYRRR